MKKEVKMNKIKLNDILIWVLFFASGLSIGAVIFSSPRCKEAKFPIGSRYKVCWVTKDNPFVKEHEFFTSDTGWSVQVVDRRGDYVLYADTKFVDFKPSYLTCTVKEFETIVNNCK
jgi:hypothetical protein